MSQTKIRIRLKAYDSKILDLSAREIIAFRRSCSGVSAGHCTWFTYFRAPARGSFVVFYIS